MLDESRVGTAMLTLQLRAAVQEATQAEGSLGDRDVARDELRGRLAVLVDRRRTDLAAQLTAEREAAARLIESAHREAAEMAAVASQPVATAIVAPTLNGRARGAMLALQLRTAMQEAADAERDEAAAHECVDSRRRDAQQWERRRQELGDELTAARVAAAARIAAARAEAAALVAAPVGQPDVAELQPDVEAVFMPVVMTDVIADAEPESVADVEPKPVAAAAVPAQQLPVNVVIDAEAFARVFAAVFATLIDERLAAHGPTVQSAMPYPTQMYAALPQPTPAPVKQSFWSHAKHVDVLLLSAAMIIVLVVLAAWLV